MKKVNAITSDVNIQDVYALLLEAKEKHLPVLIENEDKSRALYIKDADSLSVRITVEGTIGLKL